MVILMLVICTFCVRNPLKETIRGFKMILDGEMDEYPENAFFNVGTIDEVIEKAKAEKAE